MFVDILVIIKLIKLWPATKTPTYSPSSRTNLYSTSHQTDVCQVVVVNANPKETESALTNKTMPTTHPTTLTQINSTKIAESMDKYKPTHTPMEL